MIKAQAVRPLYVGWEYVSLYTQNGDTSLQVAFDFVRTVYLHAMMLGTLPP
jgi:hypothetical protein